MDPKEDPKGRGDGDTLPEPTRPYATESGAPAGVEAPPLGRGANLGRYLVLERLGGGGMGVVYAAYDPELDRKLAIKLLHPDRSGGSTQGRARLLREAQAMARLQHPNVVAVYDFGAFEEQVFVAMEFIEGGTLAQWMRATPAPRPWREVLELFFQAGRGLAAAHAAGIVHRDFKPDNVMVDRAGRARVLDFGLARAWDAEAEASRSADVPTRPVPEASLGKGLATPLTKTGSLLGTPLYMSPEQWLNRPTDARSDQFSFCNALYEALYGQRPFEGKTLVTLGAAVRKGLVGDPPAQSRVPARLGAIVRRGLSTQPEDRFATMDALLAALGRQQSVRQRRSLFAAGLVLGVIALGFGVLGLQKRRALVCAGAERKLVGIWDPGRKKDIAAAFAATRLPYADRAYEGLERAVDAYVQGWAAMHREACEATRLRGEQSDELLDLRMECLGQSLGELKAQVEVFAAADAKVVEKAVQAAQSLPRLGRCADAAALRAPVPPPADPATRARVDGVRAQIARARALERAGKYNLGLAAVEPAADQARSIPYRPLQAEVLFAHGLLMVRAGDQVGARRVLLDAALTAEATRQPEIAARAFIMLIAVSREQAQYAQAHDFARHAEAALDALGGSDEIRGSLANSLGNVLSAEGRYEEARAHLKQALELRRRALGPDHPDVAATVGNLGSVLKQEGHYDEALAEYRRSLAMAEKVVGPAHPLVCAALSNIGAVQMLQGRYDEALVTQQRVLAIRERALGPAHPDVAESLYGIGTTLRDLGRYDEALATSRRALAIWEKVLPPQHPYIGYVHNNLAGVLREQGKVAQAEAEYRLTLEVLEKVHGPEHPDVASALSNVAAMVQERGAYAEARADERKALAMRRKLLGPDHVDVANSLNTLGTILHAEGRYAEALELYRQALAMREKKLGPVHPLLATSLNNIGLVLVLEGRPSEALPDFDRALAIAEKVPGTGVEICGALLGRGLVALARHRPADAVAPLERALAVGEARSFPVARQAEPRFALARALWDSGGDRGRARALAEQAKAGFAAAGLGGTKELAAVGAWLARHRR